MEGLGLDETIRFLAREVDGSPCDPGPRAALKAAYERLGLPVGPLLEDDDRRLAGALSGLVSEIEDAGRSWLDAADEVEEVLARLADFASDNGFGDAERVIKPSSNSSPAKRRAALAGLGERVVSEARIGGGACHDGIQTPVKIDLVRFHEIKVYRHGDGHRVAWIHRGARPGNLRYVFECRAWSRDYSLARPAGALPADGRRRGRA